MKYCFKIPVVAFLLTQNALADNFVWQYYDSTFYYENDPMLVNNEDLVGVSDIYYTYTFDTKSCIIQQTEWLGDGHGNIYPASYDAEFIHNDVYLNNQNLDTELLLYERYNDFLASYREQAMSDVNTLIDRIINQNHTTNISKKERDNLADMTVNDIFNGTNITSVDIYENLQQEINALSNRNENTSSVANAINNTPNIASAKIADIKLKLDYYLHNDISEYNRLLNNITPNTTALTINTTQNVLSAINNQVSSRINSIHGRSGGDEPKNIDIWAQGLTNHSKKTGDSAFNSDTFGFTIGIDKHLNNKTIIGLGYTYNGTTASAGDRKTDITGHTIFAYGEYRPFNELYIKTLLSSGVFLYTENTGVVESDYNTYNFGANLTTGYDWNNGLGVFAGTRYFNINQNKYTDSIGQRIDSNNLSVLTIVSGGKYDAKITQIFTPNIHINMIYDVIQPNSKTNVDIAGIPYQIKGDNLNPLGIESGITFNLNKDNWDLSAGYDLEIRSDFISHTGHIRAKYSF